MSKLLAKAPEDQAAQLYVYFRWVCYLILAGACVYLFSAYSFGERVPAGFQAMGLHFRPGHRLVVHKGFQRADKLQRGDVILYRSHRPSRTVQTRRLVSRVIGLPGETIQVEAGRVLIDGDPLRDSWILLPDGRSEYRYDIQPVTVPSGFVFVINDSRHDLAPDSRTLGPISEATILGKIVM